MLPPGQKARTDFPRFGLTPYANRFPSNVHEQSLIVKLDGNTLFTIKAVCSELPRSSILADFHCVTTWSYKGAKWSGVRFVDFYETYVRKVETNGNRILGAALYAQDGYKTTLLLEDLLQVDVLLADTLNDQSLSIEHGAPLRFVAPKHYGYKNLKHLSTINFCTKMPMIKRGIRSILDHPRARVSEEERGRWIPGWLLRFVYRAFIPSTAKLFQSNMDKYNDGGR